jgi:hypothetical protein
MTVHLVYITAGSREEARRIGQALVAERLAACANILEGMQTRSPPGSRRCTAMIAPAWWRSRSAPAIRHTSSGLPRRPAERGVIA